MPRWLFFRAQLGTNFILTHNDYFYMARPFWHMPADDSIILETLDFAYKAETFVPVAKG